MSPSGDPPEWEDNPRMPPIGTAINGRYQLTKVLGQGGFATVYLAQDLLAGGDLAVKVLDPARSGQPDFVARFRQEVALVRQLRHHNTIKIWDVGSTETGCLFMVQELVEGGELSDLIEATGGLSADRVAHIVTQVLRSLSEAHDRGVIHRDLKPGNVMISQLRGEPDYVKVVDFGIAKGMSPGMSLAKTQTGAVLCTPPYASPELLRGRDIGPPVDIYSLGLMMIEMMTGEQAVQGDSLADFIVIHLSPDPIEIPPEVRATPLGPIIERAVAKELGRRYPNADEMLEDLLALTRAGPIASAPPAPSRSKARAKRKKRPPKSSTAARAKEHGRRRSRGLLFLYVGLALVVLAAVLLLRSGGEPHAPDALLGGGAGSGATPSPHELTVAESSAARQYFSDEEWAGLLAPGNLLHPPLPSLTPPDAPRGGVLRRRFQAMPLLNPILAFSPESQELYRYVHRGLAMHSFRAPERIVPDLAYRIEMSDDRLSFRVHLREGIRWQSPSLVEAGDPRHAWMAAEHFVTSDDFVFTFELLQHTVIAPPVVRAIFESLDRIEVIGELEFVLHWKEPLYQTIDLTLGMAPMPRWLYACDDDGRPLDDAALITRFGQHWLESSRVVGLGPYRIARYDRTGTVELVRWDGYVGEVPPIERLVYRVIDDSDGPLRELQADRLDIVDVGPALYSGAVLDGDEPGFTDGSFEAEPFLAPMYRYLAWNGTRVPFDDARVRRAMTMALDRRRVVDEAYLGFARIVTGPFHLDGPNYDHSIEPWPFDLERAAALLAEAGWVDSDRDGYRDRMLPGGRRPLSFSVLVADDRLEIQHAMDIYAEDLARIGVRLWIEPVTFETLLERMASRNFDAFAGGWSTTLDPDPSPLWHSAQIAPPGANLAGFRNAEADGILDELRRTHGRDGRAELFHRLHAILHREQPYTFIVAPAVFPAWQGRLRNVTFSAMPPYDYSVSWYIDPDGFRSPE